MTIDNQFYNSIPNIILKSKNNFENKQAKQFDLFDDKLSNEENILDDIEDWNTDIRLTKEFETLGFYISDHPLNQYKSIFDQYNIVSYDNFQNDENFIKFQHCLHGLKNPRKKNTKRNIIRNN